jgi:hypothetical protein
MERVDRQLHPPRNGSVWAAQDPTGCALRQRDEVEKVVKALAAICDLAMSDEAYDAYAVLRRFSTM